MIKNDRYDREGRGKEDNMAETCSRDEDERENGKNKRLKILKERKKGKGGKQEEI